jgi:hypothetical protein
MTGHTSQNALPRVPRTRVARRHRVLIYVLASLGLAVGMVLAVDRFPDTQLGRTIGMHLSQLADPQSWTP